MRALRLPSRKPVTVFVPGEHPLEDASTLRALREQGPVLVIIEHASRLGCGAEPGVWTLLAPGQEALVETALLSAEKVVWGKGVVARTADADGFEAQPLAMEAPPLQTGEPLAFCCVADTQYLPFFFALVENLRSVHAGPLEIHLLAADSQAASIVQAQFPEGGIQLYSMQDIWQESEWERIAKRPLNLRALTSKPRLLLEARRNSSAEALFLLDLDLHFYRSPAHLNQAFGEAHTLVFPQWSDQFTWARLHGMLNSGMIGARKGAEPWLAWWSRACWISCEFGVEQGRFVDQAFIDQALLYFDGIRIYRDLDEDVAPWNRRTLGVRMQGNRLRMDGDRPVGSFHAAGPDELGLFEQKYLWDQIVSVFSVIDDPNESRTLLRNVLEQQRRHWAELDQAMGVREVLATRTRLPVAATTLDWARRAVSPWGRSCFSTLAKAHQLYRRLRGSTPRAGDGRESEADFWVQLSRTALFHPERL